MSAQQANPGGSLAPGEVVGRDELVAQLWRMLQRKGLYITAERRMGKSCLVRDKMGKDTPDGWKLIYLDVSRAVSPLQFIEALLDESRMHWQLDYYDERIDTHYPVRYQPIARVVLDQLALGQPQSLVELAEGIDPTKNERDIETVRKVLRLLDQDHYITIEDKRYLFRNPFIMRIWRNVRDIGE